jgi:hypothetical protein
MRASNEGSRWQTCVRRVMPLGLGLAAVLLMGMAGCTDRALEPVPGQGSGSVEVQSGEAPCDCFTDDDCGYDGYCTDACHCDGGDGPITCVDDYDCAYYCDIASGTCVVSLARCNSAGCPSYDSEVECNADADCIDGAMCDDTQWCVRGSGHCQDDSDCQDDFLCEGGVCTCS